MKKDVPPVEQYRDVAVPETKEEYEKRVTKGVARALELANTAKDLTEVIKAATTWYQTLYGADKGGEWGAGLQTPKATNGAHA